MACARSIACNEKNKALMATHQQHVSSSEHSNGSPAKHDHAMRSQTCRKRARRMSDSESDGDTGVQFVHDISSVRNPWFQYHNTLLPQSCQLYHVYG